MATKKKTKKTSAITKVGGESNLPAHLQKHGQEGIEQLAEKVVVPRVKIIQSQSSREIRQRFGEGSCVFQPGDVILCEEDTTFLCVPVFYFNEFLSWNDVNDKSSPPIQDRSFDPQSPIAKKAQSPALRKEKYGPDGEFTRTHAEVLNFICFVYDKDHPLHTEPFVLGFQRGEFFTGQNFCSFLKLRKAPIWANVVQFKPAFREQKDREWYGLDYGNPEEGEPFITEDEVEFFQKAHRKFAELHKNRLLVVEHPTDEDEEETDDY